MGGWRQVDGDGSAADYGATLMEWDGKDFSFHKITPLPDAMGVRDTANSGDGTPFTSEQAWVDYGDVALDSKAFRDVARHSGMDEPERLPLEQRAVLVADAQGYEPTGYGDGERGWGIDVLPAHPEKIRWWDKAHNDPRTWWEADDEYLRDIEGTVSNEHVAELRLSAARSRLDDLTTRYHPGGRPPWAKRLRGGMALLRQLVAENEKER